LKGPNLLLPLRLVPWDMDSLTPLHARLRSRAMTSRQALPGEIAQKQGYSDKTTTGMFDGQMTRTGYRRANWPQGGRRARGTPQVAAMPPGRVGRDNESQTARRTTRKD
jgi:hypothetical protein